MLHYINVQTLGLAFMMGLFRSRSLLTHGNLHHSHVLASIYHFICSGRLSAPRVHVTKIICDSFLKPCRKNFKQADKHLSSVKPCLRCRVLLSDGIGGPSSRRCGDQKRLSKAACLNTANGISYFWPRIHLSVLIACQLILKGTLLLHLKNDVLLMKTFISMKATDQSSAV